MTMGKKFKNHLKLLNKSSDKRKIGDTVIVSVNNPH